MFILTFNFIMNILFIDGAGFIGSSLVKQFLFPEKYKVFVIEP